MVEVILGLAMICFPHQGAQQCHPVLIGDRTQVGEFRLQQRLTETPGYGGDVLQFLESDTEVYAVHRVWLGNPTQRRLERLANPDPRQRRITQGCINVAPEVYDLLVDCCSDKTISIR